ncbi:MAG: hypothetical protein Tsb009_17250 [Planctomycetaceae bacterium]
MVFAGADSRWNECLKKNRAPAVHPNAPLLHRMRIDHGSKLVAHLMSKRHQPPAKFAGVEYLLVW